MLSPVCHLIIFDYSWYWSADEYRALTQAHIQAQSQLIIETMVKLDTARSSSKKVRTTTTMEGMVFRWVMTRLPH